MRWLVGLAIVTSATAASAGGAIYLNRCAGGCVVYGGTDDARGQSSSIPPAGTYTVGEFANAAGQTGSAADADWAAVVQCMREVYSPYAIEVTDQPVDGSASPYVEAIVGGQPGDIGLDTAIFSIGPIHPCVVADDVIAFVFANHFAATDRVMKICEMTASETAHAFGLQHVDAFTSGASLPICSELMAGAVPSCGQRFFRDVDATCSYGACFCGSTQNSHGTLLRALGAGNSIFPVTVNIASPTAGATIGDGAVVHALAGSQRGVVRVELWLNGYPWASANGAGFGAQGQPDPSDYALAIPSGVPDSILDVVVKAYDDLGVEADSATLTITKGAPCADASTCALGQQCSAGRCYWPPPTGALGDACTYDQFCTSNTCTASTNDGQRCTQTCAPGTADACPAGFDCLDPGVCWPTPHTGGCRTSAEPSLLLGLLALLLRRPGARGPRPVRSSSRCPPG